MRWLRGWRRSRRPRRHAHRIAVFTPLPPEATGVATYSARLIPELAGLVDVDVYVADASTSEPLDGGVAILSAEDFPGNDQRDPYDDVLYCMGNSGFHHFMGQQLAGRPGTVLAHDVRFDGYYRLAALASGDPADFQARLLRESPEAESELDADGLVTAAVATRFGVFMVDDHIAHSRRFLVHSQYAAAVARSKARPEDADKIRVVSFGLPAARHVTRPDGAPVVATFGLTDPIKQPDMILGAAGMALEMGHDLRVAFVGFTDPGYEAQLRAVGRDAGLSDDRMEFTGFLDDTAYGSWLSRVTVAIQLRAASNGETSAAIGDCLRFGVPTVVSGIGSNLEYPPGVVEVLGDGASAQDLGKALGELLSDPDRRASLQRSALQFAAQSTFAKAASGIVEVMFE